MIQQLIILFEMSTFFSHAMVDRMRSSVQFIFSCRKRTNILGKSLEKCIQTDFQLLDLYYRGFGIDINVVFR
jgi:hypothetical protein